MGRDHGIQRLWSSWRSGRLRERTPASGRVRLEHGHQWHAMSMCSKGMKINRMPACAADALLDPLSINDK